MAIQRSLIVKSADALANQYAKTISNVNPDATNAQLDAFGRALVGLSTNSYIDSVRIDTESITEALAEE